MQKLNQHEWIGSFIINNFDGAFMPINGEGESRFPMTGANIRFNIQAGILFFNGKNVTAFKQSTSEFEDLGVNNRLEILRGVADSASSTFQFTQRV
jgi:hypothetical protein